jgi:hypothetical protein
MAKPKTKVKRFGWRQVLSFSTDILPKIPRRGDGVLETVVKVLGIIDSYTKVTNGQSTALFEFFSSLNLLESTNQQFVNSFFGTSLKSSFKVNHIPMGDFLDVVGATNPEIGSIYFLEWHWGRRPEYDANFWYSKGFNFEKAMGVLWKEFNNRLHIGIVFDANKGEIQVSYSEIPPLVDPLIGQLVSELEEFKEQHLKYLQDKVPRTYLLSGKQGCGKTSFALQLAKMTNGRTLRIDANGLTSVGTRDLDLVIQSLSPDFLVIDDLDRCADLEKSLPTLFSTLTDFKGKFPNVTVCITINDITKLDAALLRPGRIDEIKEFEDPNEKDREEILRGYLKEFGVEGLEDISEVVKGTEGLTGGYLKEVAMQLKYRPLSRVLKLVSRMRELASPAKTETEKKDEVPKPPVGTPNCSVNG